MARGKVWPIEIEQRQDPDTGVMVERLTDNVGNAHHPYFTQPLISADGRYVVVSSDRSGSWQVCVLDLVEKVMVQLSDDEPDIRSGGSCLDGARGVVYYWAGRSLRSVALDGGPPREHYVCPDGYMPTALSISSCGRYVAFAYAERLGISTWTGTIYSSQREQLFQCPRSVLMRVDVEAGGAMALYGDTAWYSHVSISPADPDLVMFCHEGPWLLVQRMWMARADTDEVWPVLPTQRLLQQCGHEYFAASGTVVTQYAERDGVRDATWRHANVLLNRDGGDPRYYWYRGWQPMHVQTSHHDETLMVGDGGLRMQHHDADGESMLSLIRLVEDRSEYVAFCRHETSWQRQDSHPHPVFFPDDRWVLFSSDRGGQCNVYRAAVPR